MQDEIVGKQRAVKKSRKGLWILTFIIIISLTFCYESCKLPKISGVVLDMETGKPIANADVQAMYMGPNISPDSQKSMRVGGGGTGKTDAQGRFSFHTSFIPYPKRGLWLLVYSKDYMPCFSTNKGFNPLLENSETFEVKREGNRLKGFYYTIRLKKPETESQWLDKVETVRRISMNAWGGDQIDEWLFNDLVGYLERYPNGEKAGEYIGKAMFIACVRHERTKTPSKEDLKLFLDEDRHLLMLADRMPQPIKSSGYASEDYAQNRIEIEKEIEKIEKTLEIGGKNE